MDLVILWVANKPCNFPIMVAKEANFTENASIHLENASKITKRM